MRRSLAPSQRSATTGSASQHSATSYTTSAVIARQPQSSSCCSPLASNASTSFSVTSAASSSAIVIRRPATVPSRVPPSPESSTRFPTIVINNKFAASSCVVPAVTATTATSNNNLPSTPQAIATHSMQETSRQPVVVAAIPPPPARHPPRPVLRPPVMEVDTPSAAAAMTTTQPHAPRDTATKRPRLETAVALEDHAESPSDAEDEQPTTTTLTSTTRDENHPPPCLRTSSLAVTGTTALLLPPNIYVILTRLSTAEREELQSSRRRANNDMSMFLQLGPECKLLDGKRRALSSILLTRGHAPPPAGHKIVLVSPHGEVLDIVRGLCHELRLADDVVRACAVVDPEAAADGGHDGELLAKANTVVFLGGTTSAKTSLRRFYGAVGMGTHVYVLLASDTSESQDIWDADALEARRLRAKWSDKETLEVFNRDVWPTLRDDGWTSVAAGSGLASFCFQKPGIKRKGDRVRNHTAFYSERDVCEWWSRRHERAPALEEMGFHKLDTVMAIECLGKGDDVMKLWERVEVCWTTTMGGG